MPLRPFALPAGLLFLLAFFAPPAARADQVLMKDGTVYKGKILIDTDKAILIGNPPYDPTSYLLEAQDIKTIIYEEYHPLPPAERRRGFVFESRINGNAFSSSELSLSPAASLYGGLGFRVHPVFELEGGMEWTPAIGAKDSGLSVTDATNARRYEQFWAYSATVGGRFYPFFQKKRWKTEPFLALGYAWSRLTPNASGDNLRGSGWRLGAGALRPLTTHLFLEARLMYESLSYDKIQFLGQDGQITPEIGENKYSLSVGVSYRL